MPCASKVMRGGFSARRQGWSGATAATAERHCPTVQPGGRVRFIFILQPSTIQRDILRPSTCIGPKSWRGFASWTRYPSTTTPAQGRGCMELDDFESLISRMERVARDRPTSYGRRVFWLASLGYAYLLLLVLVLTALTVAAGYSIHRIGYLGAKLTFVVGVLWLTVARSLWVRSAPPRGVVVTRVDAPQLFRLLDALRARLKSAAIHEVLVTPEFNAIIAQVPRLGIFGLHRNYLTLGLPLMKALTRGATQGRSGSRGGSPLGRSCAGENWIYRLRIIWTKLEANFDRHRAGVRASSARSFAGIFLISMPFPFHSRG